MDSLLLNEVWLQLLRFLIGSSFLLGGVWILEKLGVIKNIRMQSFLWKIAFAGSLILLIPSANYLSSVQYLDASQSKTNNSLIIFENYSASGADQSNIADKNSLGMWINKVLQSSHQLGSISFGSFVVSEIVVTMWVFLACFFLVRYFHAYRRGIKSLGNRFPIEKGTKVHNIFLEVCEKANVAKIPKLSVSKSMLAPVTLIKNEICISDNIVTTNLDDEIRSVLAHEVGHVKNRDVIQLLILQISCCVLFFQPFVFLVRNKIIDKSEFLADAMAVNCSCDPKQVALALVSSANRLNSGVAVSWASAMAGKPSRLRMRIKRLLADEQSSTKEVSIVRKIIGVSVTICAISMLPAFKVSNAVDIEASGSDTEMLKAGGSDSAETAIDIDFTALRNYLMFQAFVANSPEGFSRGMPQNINEEELMREFFESKIESSSKNEGLDQDLLLYQMWKDSINAGSDTKDLELDSL